VRIDEVNVYVLTSELEKPFSFSQGKVYQRGSVVVEVTLDNGIVGWGECMCHGQQAPEISASIIEYCYKPLLIGESPMNVGVLWERLYNRTRPYGQGGAVINALSGVDIALYDCLGQFLDQPVYNLLGGSYRDKVEAYATGFYWKDGDRFPQCWIDEANGYLADGFKGMKLKTGRGVSEDIQNINAVRESLPAGIKLMADFNCAYGLNEARKVLDETKEAKLYFYEELLAPENIDGYCAIRNSTSSNIAGGENMLTKFSYVSWMKRGALDIYQPDLCSSGGFTEVKKILAIAESTNNRVIPHVWGSGIGLMAALQLLAIVPKSPISLMSEEPLLEFDQSLHPFRSQLIKERIALDEDGFVHISDAPGLGITVNFDVIKEYGTKMTKMNV